MTRKNVYGVVICQRGGSSVRGRKRLNPKRRVSMVDVLVDEGSR